jgi:flagellar basal body-associated protein FliL
MRHTMPPPMPGFPPQPKRNHTNAIIIGVAGVLIAAVVGTGVFVVQSRDDGEGAAPAPSVSATVEPSASVSVSPECRTWIKAELLDSSEEVDATPGYEACGDLSNEELQAAIDEVTEELTAEITPQP